MRRGGGGGVVRSPHLLAIACVTAEAGAAWRHAESAVWAELVATLESYPRVWASPEEGAMLVFEELDELWDEVRANQAGRARVEAVQAAAMALRFIADLHLVTGSGQQRCRVAVGEARAARPAVGPKRPLVSTHEGAGFLRREFDAFWAAVCSGTDTRSAAARVAAMATRFIAEVGSVTVNPGESR